MPSTDDAFQEGTSEIESNTWIAKAELERAGLDVSEISELELCVISMEGALDIFSCKWFIC